jgi:hypothetical protein
VGSSSGDYIRIKGNEKYMKNACLTGSRSVYIALQSYVNQLPAGVDNLSTPAGSESYTRTIHYYPRASSLGNKKNCK